MRQVTGPANNLQRSLSIAVGGTGTEYVTGRQSTNAFKIVDPLDVPAASGAGLAVLVLLALVLLSTIVLRRRQEKQTGAARPN